MFKKIIQKKLENYVKKYFKAHPSIKLVVVAGSVGKTSTKMAIGTVLAEKFKVRLHEGNHNSGISAAVAILGIDFPENIRNPMVWLRVFRAAKTRIDEEAGVEVIVQELGIDRIGEMEQFGSYLRPNIAVITAVAPEHMEYLKDIDTVAREELAVGDFSDEVLINRDEIDGEYAKLLNNTNLGTYGTSAAAEYSFESEDFTLEYGHKGFLKAPEIDESTEAQARVVGEHSLNAVAAAMAVGFKLGMTKEDIIEGIANIHPVAGRMNLLRGMQDSVIIDDTYNSSPGAAAAALQTLYTLQVPQRIAVLGSMNEMGDISEAEHQKLGELCDPSLLSWVITVGDEANKYLAPAAKAKGCQVKSFKSPVEAGAFVHKVLEADAAVLFKGSQGEIFLEEAVKVILHATEEEHQLVRQSPEWLARKHTFLDAL